MPKTIIRQNETLAPRHTSTRKYTTHGRGNPHGWIKTKNKKPFLLAAALARFSLFRRRCSCAQFLRAAASLDAELERASKQSSADFPGGECRIARCASSAAAAAIGIGANAPGLTGSDPVPGGAMLCTCTQQTERGFSGWHEWNGLVGASVYLVEIWSVFFFFFTVGNHCLV